MYELTNRELSNSRGISMPLVETTHGFLPARASSTAADHPLASSPARCQFSEAIDSADNQFLSVTICEGEPSSYWMSSAAKRPAALGALPLFVAATAIRFSPVWIIPE